MKLQGVLATVSTPFDHTGAIYWSKVRHNIAQLNRTKLSGYLVGDQTWGEGSALAFEEKIRLFAETVGVAEERVVLGAVAGCGIVEATELVGAAAKAGCKAAVVSPDSEWPVETALLFLRTVADRAELPLIADVRLAEDGLSAEDVSPLVKHPKVAGALVSADDANSVKKVVDEVGAEFGVSVRELDLVEPCLSAGAEAAVLAEAAVAPFYCLSIEEAVRTRELEAAHDLAARAAEFSGLIETHGVPAFKHALDFRGHYGGIPRLPLLRVASEVGTWVEKSLYELAS